MIDIVCPNCNARYRLPDGTIGEAGRKVSCSACGHGWTAFPEPEEDAPLMLGPEAKAGAPDDATSASEQRQAATDVPRREGASAEAGAEATAAPSDDQPIAPDRSGDPVELAEDRTAQMAQIREMLNQIKESPDLAKRRQADDRPEDLDVAPRSPGDAASADGDDRLRSKLDAYARGDRPDTAADGERAARSTRKRDRTDERRGAGSFTTGFLLVILVIAVMVSVYLLDDEIVARFPESEPAIRDYVASMDAFRVWLAEQIAAVRAWLEGLIGG